MKKLGIIYIATDTARDNRQYVGQTTRTLEKRKKNKYNSYFQNAIGDHGDQIEWQIAEEMPVEELDIMETLYIWGLETIYPGGYNFESGGHENKTASDETRRKLSEAHKGKKHSKETRRKLSEIGKGHKHSGESKKKISEAQKGDKGYMYGKHHSEETRIKISKGNKGKKCSEESKRKMSKVQKGKRYSEESRRKMSEAHKGRKHSEESKKKISEAKIGKRRSEETKRKISETKTKWTRKEDLFLKDNYKTMKKDKLMSGLGKSWSTIYRRICRLNLGS